MAVDGYKIDSYTLKLLTKVEKLLCYQKKFALKILLSIISAIIEYQLCRYYAGFRKSGHLYHSSFYLTWFATVARSSSSMDASRPLSIALLLANPQIIMMMHNFMISSLARL